MEECMSENDAVLGGIDGNVGIMTLNRPDKFNCLSGALIDGMSETLDRFEGDQNVRSVIVRGNGKVFCTGADLEEILARRESETGVKEFIDAIHAALRRFEASPLPIVAAVHGLALAGGIETMLACDIAFMADSARIGDQHAQYGLVPGGGGTQRLARIVGLRRALDLQFSARWIDAAEAERWGLVNYVVPEAELDDRALEYCRMLGTRSREGLAFMKRITRQGLEGSPDAGLALEQTEVVGALMASDVTEGLAAFKDRREPVFQ
jgi:enoyl-CoA hydratase